MNTLAKRLGCQMPYSVFFESEFFALVSCSVVVPAAIYAFLMRTRSISRMAVAWFGLALISLSGADVFLLQRLKTMALATPSLFDDKIFASEFTIALYLLPVFFAGVGVNLVSHVMIHHLIGAEQRRDHDARKN
jgi:hypothetical protein